MADIIYLSSEDEDCDVMWMWFALHELSEYFQAEEHGLTLMWHCGWNIRRKFNNTPDLQQVMDLVIVSIQSLMNVEKLIVLIATTLLERN